MWIGLDIGSSVAKLAALVPGSAPVRLAEYGVNPNGFRLIPASHTGRSGTAIVVSAYRRATGSSLQAALDLLGDFREAFGDSAIAGIRATGVGGRRAADTLEVCCENEFKAIALGMSWIFPQIRTVFEIGGESSKYLLLDEPNGNGTGSAPAHLSPGAGILDYSMSGECAAGTGSFIDQQASRLQHRVEEIGALVARAKVAARIAGRCSVFAKSDMVHAQQKGYSTDQVLKGLCEAIARNFKSNIVKGKKVVPPVAFIGGVSQNSGVVQALTEAFKLGPSEMLVPELYAWLGAIGAALLERESQPCLTSRRGNSRPDGTQTAPATSLPSSEPLSLGNVLLLRGHPQASRTEPISDHADQKLPVYLGIDVGSVSTNLALLDEQGRLLHGIYLRTVGRPIEVVDQGLQEVGRMFGSRIEVRGVGTTGSGRELIGELVGADTVNDEITAHKTGAMYVHERHLRNGRVAATPGDTAIPPVGDVDTIFEIGGQDSKYISIDHGVVVDFAMNEACSAGTGSFLEEQAERLGIQIQDEFARLALSSTAPVRLGERCTVFMERDVTAAIQRGAKIADVAAGLAYSVALNYLNRVVRGRKIGNVIYFQGGTAYNDAVAAAFSMILGKRIIVPPHNGIIGAIGMALIAKDVAGTKSRMRSMHAGERVPVQNSPESSPSTFRGFDLGRTRFETREFVCKACSNYCEMKEITIDGRKTYWGDKCSDKFRKRARTSRKPVIDDLLAFRDRILFDGYAPALPGANGRGRARGLRVGIPRAMYFYDRFPFWQTYLRALGFQVVVSDPTDRYISSRGAELSVAEPCFPVQIAHGHVHSLLAGGPHRSPVDCVLLPNVVDVEAPPSFAPSQLCPWNQTLPFVVRAAPDLCESVARFMHPTLHFRLGPERIKRELAASFAPWGVRTKDSDSAADAAFQAQSRFSQQLLEAGHRATALLEQTGEPAVLLAGRPYNIYDRSSNCDIPRKLRDLYGVNVLPLDFLPLDEIPVDDLHPNMYWNAGRYILAAGRLVRSHPNLHIIYITNFKCGPDSFLKHFLRDVAGAPFLVLQFDGHGNDAGYLTRCEAYLDSKGILRCSSAS